MYTTWGGSLLVFRLMISLCRIILPPTGRKKATPTLLPGLLPPLEATIRPAWRLRDLAKGHIISNSSRIAPPPPRGKLANFSEFSPCPFVTWNDRAKVLNQPGRSTDYGRLQGYRRKWAERFIHIAANAFSDRFFLKGLRPPVRYKKMGDLQRSCPNSK